MNNKWRLTFSEKIFYILSYIIMVFLSLITLIPLLNVLAQSLSEPNEVLSGRVFIWPLKPTFSTLLNVLKSPRIMTGFSNTLVYAVSGTLLNLIMTIMCAYPLSRKELWGRGFITFVFTFTMLFGGGMIPSYLLIKSLGLLDTRWVMILPNAMAVWNMILARTFFQTTIPAELHESAILDGASDIKVLLSIIIPLSKPIIAVLALFYAVGHWNSYFNAMMYLSTPSLYNIQLVLRNAISNLRSLMDADSDMVNIMKTMAIAEATKYAIIVITMIPVLMIYPFVQKFFIKGIMIGSLKG